MQYLLDKNYMIVDRWSLLQPSRSTISPKPRVMIFDAGASMWNVGLGGASQSWFHTIYAEMCLFFTDWFMWEASNIAPKEVFKLLPGYVTPGYRWFNIPLTTDLASWENPLNHLLLEAAKEDVVVVKIDFDQVLVEAKLIQQILQYPEVSELIDELYFEHHVNMEIMANVWGPHADKSVSLSDSVKLFQRLRQVGIRAHSWV